LPAESVVRNVLVNKGAAFRLLWGTVAGRVGAPYPGLMAPGVT